MDNKNNINADSANIAAQGNVEFVGGNQYKIGGNVFNVDIAAPSYETSLEQLNKALESNRNAIQRDLGELEQLIRGGASLNDGNVQAEIKSLLASAKNIDTLVSTIMLKGGNAKFLATESDIVSTINSAILRGAKDIKMRELASKEDLLRRYQRELKEAGEFKLFRGETEKAADISRAQTNLDNVKFEVEALRAIINIIK
jgi:tRNA A58 N-methylase Trm61